MNRYLPLSLCLLFLVLLLALPACYKVEGDLIIDPNPDPVMPGREELKDHVVLIDSTELDLRSDSTEIQNGIYRFLIGGDVPHINIGDIIVGEQGLGFLRKVVSIVEVNGEIVLETSQASMEDVFYHADFAIDLDLEGSRQYKTLDLQHALIEFPLYDDKRIRLTASGSIGFETDLYLQGSFAGGQMDSLWFAARNTKVQASLTLAAVSNEVLSLTDEQITVAGFKKLVRAYLPVDDIQLPVVIELTTDFRLRYSAQLETGINTSITFAHDNQLDVALRYGNTDWSGSYQVDPTYNLGWAPLSGATKVLIDLELKPVLTARIYGVGGPQLAVALRQQLVGQVNEPSRDWDFSASTWLETEVAIDTRIFGETVANHSQAWETERLTYHTPFQLKKVAGDQQMQAPGLPLADPIEVRVLDEFGRPQARVPVYFKVQAGKGSVEPESVLTDANGVAATSWTLGTEPETGNTLLAQVMKADGSQIISSPLRFTAGSTFLDTVSFAGTWLMIAHSNMDCIENDDEFIRVANNQGLICHEDCTSSIVCNNGCARTIFEFAGTNVRIYSHLFDLSGVFLETDTIDYTLSFTGLNTLELIDPLDPTKKYDIEFTLNDDNELDFFATQTAHPKDCKEEILLRRQ